MIWRKNPLQMYSVIQTAGKRLPSQFASICAIVRKCMSIRTNNVRRISQYTCSNYTTKNSVWDTMRPLTRTMRALSDSVFPGVWGVVRRAKNFGVKKKRRYYFLGVLGGDGGGGGGGGGGGCFVGGGCVLLLGGVVGFLVWGGGGGGGGGGGFFCVLCGWWGGGCFWGGGGWVLLGGWLVFVCGFGWWVVVGVVLVGGGCCFGLFYLGVVVLGG